MYYIKKIKHSKKQLFELLPNPLLSNTKQYMLCRKTEKEGAGKGKATLTACLPWIFGCVLDELPLLP